jgi:hypothetical protein
MATRSNDTGFRFTGAFSQPYLHAGVRHAPEHVL